MTTGWTGKRLVVDLSAQKARVEEIPMEDLHAYLGGRGLNAKFFFDAFAPSASSSASAPPIAFGVGPLAGTLAPCSGWTSIATISPNPDSPKYVQAGLPGHWGPQLKFAGFDQLVVQGKSASPIYLAIENGKVRFEDARHVWGADTSETTIRLHEEKEGREAEVLCIGPAGENGVLFANVTHRFSWTADHVGLGYVLGSKNLKAIVLRGTAPVTLQNPERFLELCRSLVEQISRNPHAAGLKEKGTFSRLGVNGGGLGIRNYSETSERNFEERWATDYLKKYHAGREGCFACPIHCGRISEAIWRAPGVWDPAWEFSIGKKPSGSIAPVSCRVSTLPPWAPSSPGSWTAMKEGFCLTKTWDRRDATGEMSRPPSDGSSRSFEETRVKKRFARVASMGRE
jgi:aldehyde:ferredoxin oxidoreductase